VVQGVKPTHGSCTKKKYRVDITLELRLLLLQSTMPDNLVYKTYTFLLPRNYKRTHTLVVIYTYKIYF